MPNELNEYSCEAYEAEQSKINQAKTRISPDAPIEDLNQAVQDLSQAEIKRNELYDQAWDESLEVNKQYDELYSRKKQLDQEIADFRREKLGMGEGKNCRERKERANP